MKPTDIPSPEYVINFNKEVKRLSKLFNKDTYYRLTEYGTFELTPIIDNNEQSESKHSPMSYRNNLRH